MPNASRTTRFANGYTLIELLIASATASVLMAGMASSIFIASQTLQLEESAPIAKARMARHLAQMRADLSHAMHFTEKTATAVTFTVPDRDGDHIPETVRYAWIGNRADSDASHLLVYQYNGGDMAVLARDVTMLNFNFQMARKIGSEADVAQQEDMVVRFLDHTIDVTRDKGASASLSLKTPTVKEGRLLIAFLAVQDERIPMHDLGDGWQRLYDSGSSTRDATMGVWWKIAESDGADEVVFTWEGHSEAIGAVMSFENHSPTAEPYIGNSPGRGNSKYPRAGELKTRTNGTLVLRLGAFDEAHITPDSTGLDEHKDIFMTASPNEEVSAGAAYIEDVNAGEAPFATFRLGKSRDYQTVTIGISPIEAVQ